MAYYTNLFTPETWDAFRKQGGTISGFRERQRRTAERIKPGDVLICYMVRLSRWCGILEVVSGPTTDDTPIFCDPDPFVVRFRVEPRVILETDYALPAYEPNLWSRLSFTKDMEVRTFGWAQQANLRGSLRLLAEADGEILREALSAQHRLRHPHPLTSQDRRRLVPRAAIRTVDRDVLVEVPEKADDLEDSVRPSEEPTESRESHRVQAAIATIGAEMGFRVWIPRGDRQRVQELVSQTGLASLIDTLPLNYDETTLKTIEQIDVIWMKGRSMVRAFEVEHTTAVYSGLLRMADLLALQPNMDIRLHIVAPDDKRDKVMREITRPVFSLLEKGPLYESCSYISYSSVKEVAAIPSLRHTNDSIIEEYEETAHDT